MIKKERPVLPEFRAVKYRRGTGKSNVISCCIVMPRTNYFVTVCTCLPLSRGDNCIRINLYCYRDHRTRSRDRWTMMVRLVCWNIGVQISIKAGSKVVASRRAIACTWVEYGRYVFPPLLASSSSHLHPLSPRRGPFRVRASLHLPLRYSWSVCSSYDDEKRSLRHFPRIL